MQRVVAFSSITHTASDGTQVMLKALSYSKYKTTLYNEMREGYMGAVEPSRELQDGISKHLKLIGMDVWIIVLMVKEEW